MEEQSKQKYSEEVNSKDENPNNIGTLGGMILLSLPIVGIAAIIGLFKGLELFSELTEDSEQKEVNKT